MVTSIRQANLDSADTWVCACKNIRRQAFIETIKRQQLTTIEAVRQMTAINTSCGICYETVQALLDEINGR